MIATPQPPTDERDYLEIFDELRRQTPGYTPELNLTPGTVGAALGSVFAWYVQLVLQRLNQAPDKNKLAFLDALGIQLTPPQQARAALVFKLNEKAAPGIAPSGTAVGAPPPPGSNAQIVFETADDLSVMSGKLTEVFSLWPGSDSYIDHSAAYAAGQPMKLFAENDLLTIPHHLYLAHEKLFALSGQSKLNLEFQFLPAGSPPLDIVWEFWDGKVWRTFFDIDPACRPNDAAPPDGTVGMSANGRILLASDGAKADKTTVNGFASYWVRGRVNAPLASGSLTRLPLIDSVRLSSTVEQQFRASWKTSASDGRFTLAVRNAAGQIVDARVTAHLREPDNRTITLQKNTDGVFDVPATTQPDSVTVLAFGYSNQFPIATNAFLHHRINIALDLIGLTPDTALAGSTKLDTTKPFFPFGQQPQPGSTFYISDKEVFSKPGATCRIYLPLTLSPIGNISTDDSKNKRAPLKPRIEWEYWNGLVWTTLIPAPSNQGKGDFSQTEVIEFLIPVDIETTNVGGTDGLWIRARLVSDSFGYIQSVTWQSGTTPETNNTVTYIVTQPPVLAGIQLVYTWQYGPFRPDRVITYNDFQYKDRTDPASWPGATFAPYERTTDVTPALYLGFDKQPPAGDAGILFNIAEQRGDVLGPAMSWEYWNGALWCLLTANDETRNLRLPGILAVITEEDSAPLARFDAKALYWLRGRLKDDGPPGEPVVNGIYPNAVWASQQTTITDSPIGQSNGGIDQVFSIPQIPILAGERIEVREVSGARANVEWRLIAMDLFKGDAKRVESIENALAAEGTDPEVIDGDLRLRRDRLKKVSEVWVKWNSVATLEDAGPNDRSYVLDRARGLLQFGDGRTGRVPPNLAAILGRKMQSGGGLAGNVAAATITQLRGVVAGIDSIANPLAAEGGSDGEPLSALVKRGPKSVRHRGRAMAPDDYATLAREASSAVGYARAVPTMDPGGHPLPGWVTVLIIPRSLDPRPQPSFGLREEVRRFIGSRAPAELDAGERVYVTGPAYQEINVIAVIAPVTAPQAGEVEQASRDALNAFLHPLTGGPNGEGWDLGRSVFLSDVAAALAKVPGIDHIEALTLLANSEPQGSSVTVKPDRIPVAGAIHIRIAAPR
jgi:uncharacterized phage protein gp47/JayE